MKFELRDYQKQAVEKILWSKETLNGNDICVLPTGAGKSIVIAELAHRLNSDVLILQPNKEILEQNYKKMLTYVDPFEVGIYSASMKEKIVRKYTFATIQSIYKKPDEFKHFKIVLIDECHLVNPKNLTGMFTTFLKEIGNPKVIGFTATPYRLGIAYTYDNGFLNGYVSIKLINRMKPFFWNRIIFNINNHELVDQGYLCPITYHDYSIIKQEEIPVNKSGSDFDLFGYEKKISNKYEQIQNVIKSLESKVKSILVFCSSVNQAKLLNLAVTQSAYVSGTTALNERTRIIEGFKEGTIKTVFNVGVLTTGFDHPALDCIVLARPTRSIGLYYQMLGRGVRKAEGKTTCHLVDLTNTVEKLGKIESIKMIKEDKWELVTETGYWHDRELYSFQIDVASMREEKKKLAQAKSVNSLLF